MKMNISENEKFPINSFVRRLELDPKFCQCTEDVVFLTVLNFPVSGRS